MIRALVIIAVGGFILSLACLGAAAAIGGRAIAEGDLGDSKILSAIWNEIRDENFDQDPGETTTREFDWEASDSLDINVPAEVTYTQGPAGHVTITGPENIIDRIDVSRGDIGFDGQFRGYRGGSEHIRIEIEAPDVQRFELNGAQQFRVRDFDQEELVIEMNGAADVDARGRAGRARIEMNGAGHVDLADLMLDEIEVQMNGAGDLKARPTERADVEINGVGEITLLGEPKVLNKDVHGFGNVRIRDRSESDEDETAAQEDPSEETSAKSGDETVQSP